MRPILMSAPMVLATQAALDYKAAEPQLLAQFGELWNNISPNMCFERNPWVWVINFKRVKL